MTLPRLNLIFLGHNSINILVTVFSLIWLLHKLVWQQIQQHCVLCKYCLLLLVCGDKYLFKEIFLKRSEMPVRLLTAFRTEFL